MIVRRRGRGTAMAEALGVAGPVYALLMVAFGGCDRNSPAPRPSSTAQPHTEAAVAAARPTSATGSSHPSVGPDRVLFDSGLVRISSDAELSPASCRSFAARAEKAYRRSAELHGWAVEGALTAPFTLHMISQALIDKEHPGINLVAQGKNDVFGNVVRVDDAGFTDGALLHEETHLLHSRMGQGGLGHYLEEGLASDLQRLYDTEFSQGKERFVLSMRGQAPALARLTPEAARPLLEQTVWQDKDIWLTESMGTLFVEFLRTRLDGAGYPDYVRRIAHMVETMPRLHVADGGWRQAYLRSLHAEFGNLTEQKFLDYLRDTQGQPAVRLAGTVFEPWLKDEEVERSLRTKPP